MTLSTLYLTVLRLIHIFSAVTWVGGGIFFLSVIAPTAQAAGPDGGKFMQWIARQGRVSKLFGIASGLTFLSGLLLFWSYSGHLNGKWLLTPHGITLSIGALLGISAFVHAMAVSMPISRKLTAQVIEMMNHQGPPAPEKIAQAQALGAAQGKAGLTSVTLGSLALFFMAAAQTIV